ncbi:MAG: hypothetical protein ABSD49_04645 [Candidatus Bathyarchaeia archaeon]|jgi:hypothetical protein
MLPEESFSVADLGRTIAKMLGLQKNQTVELKRDRLDRNRIMIIRHPGQEEQKTIETDSRETRG